MLLCLELVHNVAFVHGFLFPLDDHSSCGNINKLGSVCTRNSNDMLDTFYLIILKCVFHFSLQHFLLTCFALINIQ
jgi:hypothetical protein